MKATQKNIERLSKKVQVEKDKWFGDSKPYEKELAEQKAYFKELKAIAAGESKALQQYLDELKTGSGNTNANNGNGTGGKSEAELKAEEATLKKLEALREKYGKLIAKRQIEQLIENTNLKNIKRLELEKDAALKEAESLGASKELLRQIEKEHDERINEEKLERLKAFEERKRELENELELEKAETDQEKEELQEEQRLEKEEAALEQMQLTKAEKEELLELMEQNHQQRLLDIQTKYNDERAAENKKFYDELIAAEENLQAAKNNALASGINSLQGFFDESSGIYHALFLLEKGLAAGEVITNMAKGIAAAKANLAAVPPVIGVAPNPMYAVAAATAAKNILATKITAAAQLAAIGGATIQGFSGGGYTDMFGQGYKDGSGHEVAGVVHTNEYVVPEIVRRDPEVPQILDYLETKRKKKLGLYATGGDTANEYSSSGSGSASSSSFGNSKIERLLENILLATSENRDILFGPEAEMKRQEQQKKLDKLKESTQIK